MSVRTKYRRLAKAGLCRPTPRYRLNESFFETWGDELAWLVGLIWSDGCLRGNMIDICSVDLEMLQTVTRLVGQDVKILPKNKGDAYCVRFSSNRIAMRLRSIGLTERKSLIIAWPVIPEEFEGSFMRGVLDGDGSVLLNHTRLGQQVADCVVIFYTASPVFRDAIYSWLEKHGIGYTVRDRDNRFWYIQIRSQRHLKALYPLLYPGPDVPCLYRKRANYDHWISTPRARSGRPSNSKSKS